MTLRIRLYSDLHLEHDTVAGCKAFIDMLPTNNVDVVALCGDITSMHDLNADLKRFARHFSPTPVLFVPGNHEYYGATFSALQPRTAAAEDECGNLQVLDNDVYEHPSGQRFVGSTLWYPDSPESRIIQAGKGKYVWTDFEFVRGDPMTAGTIARRFLEQTVRPGDVVLTHMLPSATCVTARWRNHDSNRFFVHDCESIIRDRGPVAWLFGHTHDSNALRIGDTALHCNPRGYPGARNPAFTIDYTVEV